MRNHTFSSAILPTFAALALVAFPLAGCAEQADGDAASSDSSEESGGDEASGDNGSTANEAFAVSETGWLTIGTDGAVQTTFFDPDGRYRDLRNGDVIGAGQWELRSDGTLCFEPDTGLGACWENSVGDDGNTILMTDADGKVIEIKRVTYIAPSQSENPDAASTQ